MSNSCVLAGKGIEPVGESVSRWYTTRHAIGEQLLPVYETHLFAPPPSAPLLDGTQETWITATHESTPGLEHFLDDASAWALQPFEGTQTALEVLAQAFPTGKALLRRACNALALGDNIGGASQQPSMAGAQTQGATGFPCAIQHVERDSVMEFGAGQRTIGLQEEPERSESLLAVTRLYFYESHVGQQLKEVRPSLGRKLEIAGLNRTYLERVVLQVQTGWRGFARFDTGTDESNVAAGRLTHTCENRHGLRAPAPKKRSLRKGWIVDVALERRAISRASARQGTALQRRMSEMVL